MIEKTVYHDQSGNVSRVIERVLTPEEELTATLCMSIRKALSRADVLAMGAEGAPRVTISGLPEWADPHRVAADIETELYRAQAMTKSYPHGLRVTIVDPRAAAPMPTNQDR